MKKMVCLMMTALMVLGAVSCKEKEEESDDVIKNFWKVKSTHGNDGGSDLNYAWYFYDEERDGYSFVFSLKDNLDSYYNDGYVWVDLPKSRCGEKHNLTETLSSSTPSPGWTFMGATSTISIKDGNFTDGTISVTINEEKGKVLFQMQGTLKNNETIRVRYSGKVPRVNNYIGLD